MTEAAQSITRRVALANRRALSPQQHRHYSHRIASSFINSSMFYRASAIGVYLSTASEVDTSEIVLRIWRAKKSAYAPFVNSDGSLEFRLLTPKTVLMPNQFNILEPVNTAVIRAQNLDLALLPLAAFDDNNNRIGMGGGYYDRCFAFQRERRHWRKPMLAGLGFDCQRQKEIASNPWDIPLQRVFTESA